VPRCVTSSEAAAAPCFAVVALSRRGTGPTLPPQGARQRPPPPPLRPVQVMDCAALSRGAAAGCPSAAGKARPGCSPPLPPPPQVGGSHPPRRLEWCSCHPTPHLPTQSHPPGKLPPTPSRGGTPPYEHVGHAALSMTPQRLSPPSSSAAASASTRPSTTRPRQGQATYPQVVSIGSTKLLDLERSSRQLNSVN
jgi:hypothetical protein